MQTLMKKWDDLSIDEVPSVFGLRSEVLVKESLKHLKNKKENIIKISAQSYLKKFYLSHGFIPKGDEYLEDNIPHIAMFLIFS